MTIHIPLPFWAIMLIVWAIGAILVARGNRSSGEWFDLTPVFAFFFEIIWALVALCIYLLGR